MNRILTGLGIPLEVQAFFNIAADLSFCYGDQYEHYDERFHIVPATTNLWFAGTQNATHLIITHSVMEAMAFITLNRHRYPRLEQLAFVAIGNRLHVEQGDWIRQTFPGRKVTLVFGKDLVGHITDIKLVAVIKNIPIRIFYKAAEIHIYRDDSSRIFKQEHISLHAFQEAFGIRPRFRTGKPVNSLTFLDQLKYDSER
ncbi:hypothetical protein [Mucilaginibacter polytrichastri]|uniref:Uncharacterized protein n=1 Tax=Mucilaginibacter polytrichastri TaxID=1302689 RepID=A0A1Q6A2D2_9SPHI|nr:hypothetical protein [Mucilaginibacter polytrichastri]OKS88169.1 hypothetical protein RG47T_3633 [Mucilaginibacter polytrichastri]SFT08955.1 hypothetical protein SAMN04487890_11075 [Mucilaginibacter polytrichastri]